MIYTVSANPLHLPKNMWLCEAYVLKGTEPKYTAYSPSVKKWGEGHEKYTAVKFTLDAPPFSVYTTECYSKQWVNLEDFYIDLDSQYIYHGGDEISWSLFTDYLHDCGIKLNVVQLATLFQKPELLKDKVYAWNIKLKPNDLVADLLSDLETTTTTSAETQALDEAYEQIKKTAFNWSTVVKVKKPDINPYKWVLSGGKITYTPTEQVTTNGKPEF